jgi:hypothetical protein
MSIGSEGSATPAWFRNERANALPDSKGEKKLRFDLFEMLDIRGLDKKSADIANQFLIAAATDDVVEDSNARKTARLPGRVAVRIEMVVREDALIYKYAFLNLNSLAKRLNVDPKKIKEHEKIGDLYKYIKSQIYISAKEQASIASMLNSFVRGEDVFEPKLVFKEYLDDSSYSSDSDLEDVDPAPQTQQRPAQKINREVLSDFITKHFSDDDYLTAHLEEFLNQSKGKAAVNNYAKHLVKKLWWDPGELGNELGVQPGKRALTSVGANKPADLGLSTFVGKAASRPGNAGSEVTSRIGFIEGDISNRYAIATDDFVYTEKPEPRSRNEVALALSDNLWVLANKNSLKRLGLTNAEISGSAEDLAAAVHKKREKIAAFSSDIMNVANRWIKEKGSGVIPKVTEKDMLLILGAKDHPDEMIKDMSKEFLKALDTWNKKQADKRITKSNILEKAVGRFNGFIEKLEEADLIQHKLSKARKRI